MLQTLYEVKNLIRFAEWPGRDLESALKKEWLETNGIGGFASSTIVGLNTRRYHGLLTAATRPPVGRMVLLSKLEETLIVDGERYQLSCNEFPGAIFPDGHRYLAEFRLHPFPVFVYRVRELTIEKQVFMVYGENTTVVHYEFSTNDNSPLPPCTVEINPLVAFRDYHSLTHFNDALNRDVRVSRQTITIAPYADLPALHFAHDAAGVQETGDWYYNFSYRVEEERGLDAQEDLFNPFVIKFDIGEKPSASVIVSTGTHDISEAPALREKEILRRRGVVENAAAKDSFTKTLVSAADQFIVQRGELQTVIAGYHWFSDWGRDTMIALPGLTLVRGQFETAKKILKAFAGAVDRGMLPNRWPDAGETPEYNTVDATLWFFEAVGALMRYTGDYEFVRSELYSKLTSIIDWHVHGTRFGIRMNGRGLIECGEAGAQLTWMDAKIGDYVVTPRAGMPVEIQALWYNALRTLEHLSNQLSHYDAAQLYSEMAERAKASFDELFWNNAENCLYDVIGDDKKDGSIRPNQIFAVSLTHAILEGEPAQLVVDRVERDLLSPRGLRSLARNDPQYHPTYVGNSWQRDSAYHQGTVWAWLMGPFVNAYLRVNGNSQEARQKARGWLKGFEEHFLEAGLGQVSEIFDGDPPHQPRGCIAQAWSVAEILRAWVEDLNHATP